MNKIDYQALRDNAESTIGILENIAGFEPSDIDGDAVELRFETDGGFDTGCDVSIVDQCQKAADAVRALLVELEAAEKRIAELESLAAPKLTQQATVVPDEMTPKQASRSYCGEVRGYRDGWNACRAAILKSFGYSEQLDEVGSWNNHRNAPTAQDGNHTEQNLDMVDHFGDATQKAMLHGSEPETDNTNQQFESLGRGDK